MSIRLEESAIHLKKFLELLDQTQDKEKQHTLQSLIDHIYKQAEDNSDHEEIQSFQIALTRNSHKLDFRYADNYLQHHHMNEKIQKLSRFQLYGTCYSLHEVISTQDFTGASYIINYRKSTDSMIYTMFQVMEY